MVNHFQTPEGNARAPGVHGVSFTTRPGLPLGWSRVSKSRVNEEDQSNPTENEQTKRIRRRVRAPRAFERSDLPLLPQKANLSWQQSRCQRMCFQAWHEKFNKRTNKVSRCQVNGLGTTKMIFFLKMSQNLYFFYFYQSIETVTELARREIRQEWWKGATSVEPLVDFWAGHNL